MSGGRRSESEECRRKYDLYWTQHYVNDSRRTRRLINQAGSKTVADMLQFPYRKVEIKLNNDWTV